MFWERGRCDRGLQCSFYHDPSIKQTNAQTTDAAMRDVELELSVHLAHAAALLVSVARSVNSAVLCASMLSVPLRFPPSL